MSTKPLYQRNIEGSRILYEVLSSKKTFYYTVTMLGPTALDCECAHFIKGHKHCRHMVTAETAEQEFQQSEISNKPIQGEQVETDADRRATAPLNGNKPFSLLRE